MSRNQAELSSFGIRAHIALLNSAIYRRFLATSRAKQTMFFCFPRIIVVFSLLAAVRCAVLAGYDFDEVTFSVANKTGYAPFNDWRNCGTQSLRAFQLREDKLSLQQAQ
jgi:hypothetical protein